MPQRPNKIAQFWQELKRRRVIHVITVYASASFVLIELVNNLSESLSLPAKLSTILVVILAVGFPLAIILAWIYDLTPEGVERTRTAEDTSTDDQTKFPNAWRIATYVSFVVIVGLVTLNIVGRAKGLKAGDIQSLVILPFDNFTGDEKLEYFVSGMHAYLSSYELWGDFRKESLDRAYEYRKIILKRFFSEELIQSFDQIFKEQGYVAAEKEIVRQFELLAQEKYVSSWVLAARHYSNKEYSKALDDLEQGYASHEPNMPYLATGFNGFTDLYDSARFISIVEKMNLPLPNK